MRTYLHWAYIAWLPLLMLYGTNLYFSATDIDNPAVNNCIPLLKDIFWLIIIASICIKSKLIITKISFKICTAIFVFCVVFLIKIFLINESIDISYIKIFKNLILYCGFTAIFMGMVCKYGLADRFFNYFFKVSLLSIIISLSIYFYNPNFSHTARMFGTFGNPNSAGLISVFALTLLFLIRLNFVLKIFIALLLIVAIHMSGSLTAFAMMLFALPISVFVATLQHKRKFIKITKSFLKYYLYLLILISLSFIVFNFYKIYTPLIKRIDLIVSGSNYNLFMMILAAFTIILAGSGILNIYILKHVREKITSVILILACALTFLYFLVTITNMKEDYFEAYENAVNSNHESITIRLNDYNSVFNIFRNSEKINKDFLKLSIGELEAKSYRRYDSFLLSIFHNFGMIGVVLIFILVILRPIGGMFSKYKRIDDYNKVVRHTLFYGFIISLILFNLPLQYQFAVFPTNFIIIVIITFVLTDSISGFQQTPDLKYYASL